ncbi:MAG TPA: hypothetical protein VD836_14570, partial [Solirubrobacteraceae bacterium]|nr:hypothetical protein [Solirubrobacteraceae bacterium]
MVVVEDIADHGAPPYGRTSRFARPGGSFECAENVERRRGGVPRVTNSALAAENVERRLRVGVRATMTAHDVGSRHVADRAR